MYPYVSLVMARKKTVPKASLAPKSARLPNEVAAQARQALPRGRAWPQNIQMGCFGAG